MTQIACLGMSALLATAALSKSSAEGIETVGLYGDRGVQDQYSFWKACGINLVQFCDAGPLLKADTLDKYYAEFAHDIEVARKAGFKVWVLLLANIGQLKGNEDNVPGMGLRYYPRNRAAMQERLDYIAKAVSVLRSADGFTFFAGDPGGVPKALGPSTVHDWIAMAREVHKVVKRESPQASFNVNPWAVVQWEDEGMNVAGTEFWLKEGAFTRTIINEPGLLGREGGIEFPAHNYYRSLTLRVFNAAGLTPERCPSLAEVNKLRTRGVKRLWAWPYFLLDEVDDGYIGSVWKTFGQTQAETRYLHKVVKDMRGIGINGIIGNHSISQYCRAEALNVYAFGRFCHDPSATPAGVIEEFAGYVATKNTAPNLARALRFIENHSSWHASLPKEYRLKDMDCGNLTSLATAIESLSKVTPRSNPTYPLPEPPAEYLKRLRHRLEMIASTEGPGETALEAQAEALFAPLTAR